MMLKAAWVLSLFLLLGYAYEWYLGAVVMGIIGFDVARMTYQTYQQRNTFTKQQKFDFFTCYFVLLGRMCYLSTSQADSKQLFITQLKFFNLPKVEENNALKLFESGFNNTVNLYDMLAHLKYTLPAMHFICVMVFRLSQVEKGLNNNQKQLLINVLEYFGIAAIVMIDLLTEYIPETIANDLKPYYQVLQLPSDADFHQVKMQFRRLVKQHHPDKTKNPDDHQKVQEIIRAYEILKVYYQKGKAGDQHVV